MRLANFLSVAIDLLLVTLELILLILIGSPIRSLIESGFGASKRSDVRLYYGARNVQRMAYQVFLLCCEAIIIFILKSCICQKSTFRCKVLPLCIG